MRFIILGMGAMGSLLAAKICLGNTQIPENEINRERLEEGKNREKAEKGIIKEKAEIGITREIGEIGITRKKISVIGLCRGTHYDKIKSEGLIFEDLEHIKHLCKEGADFKVYNSKKEIKRILKKVDINDWIVITSKTYDLERLIGEYKGSLENQNRIVLLQNGIGNEDIVHRILPNIIIYRATTTMGAFLVNPGYVRHTGLGITKLGYPNINSNINLNMSPNADERYVIRKSPDYISAELKALSAIFNTAGMNTEIPPNIDVVCWEKIFINVGINAIAALKGVPNGELLRDEPALNRLKALISEAWTVGRAMGIDLDKVPDRYIQLTLDVIQKTAMNRNSMLQDLMKRKPTEIDFINGRIVQYAKKLGIDVPENEKITLEIKEREKANRI